MSLTLSMNTIEHGPRDRPLVSVITISFNSAATIARALESVAAQRAAAAHPLEQIVVDGASTDGTVDIVRACAARYDHLQWLSEPDDGIYHAINKGIERALGEFVLVLNSDDYLEDHAFERFEDFVAAHPGHDIYYGDETVIDEDGNIREEHHTDHRRLDQESLRHQAAFIRTEVHDQNRVGPYSRDYRFASDYDFFLRCREQGCAFIHMPFFVSRFQFGGASSEAHVHRSFEEFMQIKRSHGIQSFRQSLPTRLSFYKWRYGGPVRRRIGVVLHHLRNLLPSRRR